MNNTNICSSKSVLKAYILQSGITYKISILLDSKPYTEYWNMHISLFNCRTV